MTETDTQLQRPRRADALRNRDNLVATARDVFAADGTSAPLEDVAERAGVGIGTLYRHFPNRRALLEAVYRDEVEAMARSADELADADPWEALSRWFHEYVGFAATKRALGEALLEAGSGSDDALVSCRTMLADAGARLVERAQKSGAVRPDVEFIDVARIVGGIAISSGADDEQKERMLGLVLDGLRPPRG
jgi:AcrR family transcriptional regulator